MWSWQNSNQPGDPGQSTSGPPPTVHPHPGAVANPVAHGQPGHGQPQGQELSDMLQMLDQSGTTSFEDLNIHMFNTPFE